MGQAVKPACPMFDSMYDAISSNACDYVFACFVICTNADLPAGHT